MDIAIKGVMCVIYTILDTVHEVAIIITVPIVKNIVISVQCLPRVIETIHKVILWVKREIY